MNEASYTELSAWLTQAGLDGTSEADILGGFCERCVAAGLPLDRAQAHIDTLHPVHEGRLFRWGTAALNEPALVEYGRTNSTALAASGFDPEMSRSPNSGRAAPTTGCCKPVTRCCADV